MKKEGKITRLKEAKETSERITLMLIYPETRPIFMTGYVLEIFDDCFKFNDRRDGKVELGYTYIEEIKEARG